MLQNQETVLYKDELNIFTRLGDRYLYRHKDFEFTICSLEALTLWQWGCFAEETQMLHWMHESSSYSVIRLENTHELCEITIQGNISSKNVKRFLHSLRGNCYLYINELDCLCVVYKSKIFAFDAFSCESFTLVTWNGEDYTEAFVGEVSGTKLIRVIFGDQNVQFTVINLRKQLSGNAEAIFFCRGILFELRNGDAQAISLFVGNLALEPSRELIYSVVELLNKARNVMAIDSNVEPLQLSRELAELLSARVLFYASRQISIEHCLKYDWEFKALTNVFIEAMLLNYFEDICISTISRLNDRKLKFLLTACFYSNCDAKFLSNNVLTVVRETYNKCLCEDFLKLYISAYHLPFKFEQLARVTCLASSALTVLQVQFDFVEILGIRIEDLDLSNLTTEEISIFLKKKKISKPLQSVLLSCLLNAEDYESVKVACETIESNNFVDLVRNENVIIKALLSLNEDKDLDALSCPDALRMTRMFSAHVVYFAKSSRKVRERLKYVLEFLDVTELLENFLCMPVPRSTHSNWQMIILILGLRSLENSEQLIALVHKLINQRFFIISSLVLLLVLRHNGIEEIEKILQAAQKNFFKDLVIAINEISLLCYKQQFPHGKNAVKFKEFALQGVLLRNLFVDFAELKHLSETIIDWLNTQDFCFLVSNSFAQVCFCKTSQILFNLVAFGSRNTEKAALGFSVE